MADENIVDEVVDTKVVTPAATVDDSATDTGLVTDLATDDTPPAKSTGKAPVTPDWPADWRDKAAAERWERTHGDQEPAPEEHEEDDDARPIQN